MDPTFPCIPFSPIPTISRNYFGLPKELWKLIFDPLHPEDRKGVALVCRDWRSITPPSIRIVKPLMPDQICDFYRLFLNFPDVVKVTIPYCLLNSIKRLERIRELTINDILPQNLSRVTKFISETASRTCLTSLSLIPAERSSYTSYIYKDLFGALFKEIRRCAKLEKLQLLPGYKDITLLANLPLRTLNFRGISDEDIQALPCFTQITKLSIVGLNAHTDLCPLANLTNLQTLAIDRIPVKPCVYLFLNRLQLRDANLNSLFEYKKSFPNVLAQIKSLAVLAKIRPSADLLMLCQKDRKSGEEIYKFILVRSLSLAMRDQWKETLDYVIFAGVNLDVYCPKRRAPFWFTLISNRGFELLNYMIEKGINVHLRDDYGSNILHYIAVLEDISPAGIGVYEKIIRKQVDLLQKNLAGETPFIAAIKTGQLWMAIRLLNDGSTLQDLDSLTEALFSLVRHTDLCHGYLLSLFCQLKDKGIDFNHLHQGRASFFDAAVQAGSTVALRIATQFKIRPRSIVSYELIFSAGHLALTVAFLKAYNGNLGPNLEDFLFITAAFGDKDQVARLVAKGVDINARNEAGQYAWEIALLHQRYEMASYLYRP